MEGAWLCLPKYFIFSMKRIVFCDIFKVICMLLLETPNISILFSSENTYVLKFLLLPPSQELFKKTGKCSQKVVWGCCLFCEALEGRRSSQCSQVPAGSSARGGLQETGPACCGFPGPGAGPWTRWVLEEIRKSCTERGFKVSTLGSVPGTADVPWKWHAPVARVQGGHRDDACPQGLATWVRLRQCRGPPSSPTPQAQSLQESTLGPSAGHRAQGPRDT